MIYARIVPSLNRLQDLADIMPTDYAKRHRIFFTGSKSVGVLFKFKKFCISASSVIFLCRNIVSLSDNVKYLKT